MSIYFPALSDYFCTMGREEALSQDFEGLRRSQSMPSMADLTYGKFPELETVKEIYQVCFKKGEGAKISRCDYQQLHHSYYVAGNGEIFQHRHGTFSHHFDHEKNGDVGFIDEGFRKQVYQVINCTGNQKTVRVVSKDEVGRALRFSPDSIRFNRIFQGSKHLLVGHYIKYPPARKSHLKWRELFLLPEMDTDLFKLIGQNELLPSTKKKAMTQIALGLQEMHRKKWHHGDVKLENCMVKYDEKDPENIEVRLGDPDFSSEVTADTTLLWGSPGMLDPRIYWEYVKGDELYKADIFSLGVTLTEFWLEIFEFAKFSWVPDVFFEVADYSPPTSFEGQPATFERKAMEDLGFISEPEDKTTIDHLLWRMCSPLSAERPNIEEVVDFLRSF